MKKAQTWNDNINNVVRDIMFADTELIELMMIPDEYTEDIITFTDKYFVRDPAPDELITNEPVRICYYQDKGTQIGMNVNSKILSFDIYVKNSCLHNVSNDLLQSRDEVIGDKLIELLTSERYVCNIRFRYFDSYHLFTKLSGYHRYRVDFIYGATY